MEYNLLYAFDAYPNIVLCFTAGLLINDKLLGLRRSINLFLLLIFLGQIIFTVSAHLQMFSVAIMARVICGIGIECQNVTFYALIALWFTEKEHGMASAVSAMMIRLGMVCAEFSTPQI